MPTTVIDTADWSLIVPLRPALNLAGSRLTATMTGAFGGAPAAVLDSADGSIAWATDAYGLTSALTLSVATAARGAWSAIGVNGLPGLVTLYFDVHRVVDGSTRDEWLGRSSVSVYPATDSAAVRVQAPGAQPLFVGGQPCTGVLLPALATGPQGPQGLQGVAGASAGQTAPTFTAGATLSGHMAVRAVGDGSVLYASADQPAQAGTVLGITIGAAQAGAEVSVVTAGPVDEPSWAFAPGPVWLGLNGALTQVLPQSGMLQQVGIALLSTRLLVAITPAILL